MPKKLTFEYIKEFINKENLLISIEYINSKEKLKIECNKCKEIYNQTYEHYKKGHRHQKCANLRPREYYSEIGKKASIKKWGNKPLLKDTTRICEWCKNEYNPKRSEQILCNRKCSQSFLNKDKDVNFLRSQKGGAKSAKSQQLRGKAEIYFSELCIIHFGKDNIICNERIFKDKNGNFWDCDILIKSLKIAILYDGIHHYKKIYKNQKLDHIQARDKIKRSIILDNGYTYYTVKDLGGFNKIFVENEFNLFIHKLHFKKVISNIKKDLKMNYF